MYDGTRAAEYLGRPYALDVERLSEGKGNGGPSAPRSREIRRCMHATDIVHTEQAFHVKYWCSDSTYTYTFTPIDAFEACHRAPPFGLRSNLTVYELHLCSLGL